MSKMHVQDRSSSVEERKPGADLVGPGAERVLAMCEFPGTHGPLTCPEPGAWEPREHSSTDALAGALGGLPAYEVVPRAERTLATTALRPATAPVLLAAVRALLCADRAATAAAWTRKLAQAAHGGSAAGWEVEFRAQLALAEHRRGQLRAAQAHVNSVRALAGPDPSWSVTQALNGIRTDALVHGDHRPLVPEVGASRPPSTSLWWIHDLYTRAERHREAGRLLAARQDFLACARTSERWGLDLPTVAPWRSGLARVQAQLGDRPRALALALAEVELARPRAAPRVLGNSLRTAGMLALPPFRMELLREAVSMHRSVDAELELARSLRRVGDELLAEQDRRAARDALKEAVALAEECEADGLVETVHARLAAAGARQRAGSGASSRTLTAAQQRVADLVVAGSSNRDIAERLSLTVSTVEQHLTQIYRKLAVAGRAELAGGATAGGEVADA